MKFIDNSVDYNKLEARSGRLEGKSFPASIFPLPALNT